MRQVIKYDLNGSYDSGIKIHPKIQVENLGMTILKFEGIPIADCCMMEVENIPEVLPKYITIVKHGHIF